MPGRPDRSRLKGLSKRWREEKVWHLDRVFAFGQYRGCTLRDVLDTDLDYIRFLKEHGRIELGRDAIEYMDDRIEEEDVVDFMSRHDRQPNRTRQEVRRWRGTRGSRTSPPW